LLGPHFSYLLRAAEGMTPDQEFRLTMNRPPSTKLCSRLRVGGNSFT
jgi:hypothetical protein